MPKLAHQELRYRLHNIDGPVNDGILMAQFFLNKGYNVVYLCDATPHQYYKWMDWLLSNVKQELVSYFSGHGGQTPDRTGLESDGLSEVMVFYNAQKKKGSNKEKITNIVGISDDTVEDTVMHDLVISKDYPKTRIVLLSDCCHSGTMFNLDQPWPPKGKLMAPITQRLNIIHVGAAVDSQTAKQKTQGGMACGAFTYSLINLLKSNPRSSFKDLEAYCLRNIIKDQVVQLTATDMNNLNQQIIISRR
ncbi:MAG: hypothetical protein EZS28_020154 [Streblomastix strix]|uniref:Peptidase C14 caspase domain-containing protein n=1 Tax=Streblomastix strix TaxID=222440 RepID=A0A5J4VP05_9EUKA|nr:MAG: hypothetical protein EZS28_020154 [Streblomastix strix]